MKLGFDFDGVITDPVELKSQWILKNLGVQVAPGQTTNKACKAIIGNDVYARMIRDIYAGSLALTNKVRPEAISVFGSLLARGHSVSIITSRLNQEAVCARELIKMHGVPHNGFYNTEETPKDGICRELGIELFVDDGQRKLIELASIPGITLVFFNEFGEEPAPGIVSVASWQELERFILSR